MPVLGMDADAPPTPRAAWGSVEAGDFVVAPVPGVVLPASPAPPPPGVVICEVLPDGRAEAHHRAQERRRRDEIERRRKEYGEAGPCVRALCRLLETIGNKPLPANELVELIAKAILNEPRFEGDPPASAARVFGWENR